MANKYEYLIVLQQYWGAWEDIIEYPDTVKGRCECKQDWLSYRDNEPDVPLRRVRRRVPVAQQLEK